MSTTEVDSLMPFAGGRRPKPRHRPGATAKRERQLRAKERLEKEIEWVQKTSIMSTEHKEKRMKRALQDQENLNRNLSPVRHNVGPSDEVHG